MTRRMRRGAPTSRPCPPDRGRWARDHLAVDGREHEHPLGALARHRQQDPVERRPGGRLEDEELALARVDREASSPASRATSSARRPGAVDGHAAAHHGRRPRRSRGKRVVARARSPRPGHRSVPRRRRRPRRRPAAGVGDRVGDRLAGTSSEPSSWSVAATSLRRGSIGQRRDRSRSPSPAGRSSAPQRIAGTPSRSSRVAQLAERRISRVSSSPMGVEPVWRIPELVPLRPARAQTRPRDRDGPPRATSACARRPRRPRADHRHDGSASLTTTWPPIVWAKGPISPRSRSSPLGDPELDDLRSEFDAGAVDTVLLCIADMEGACRASAYRHALPRRRGEHGAEGCNYLLAVDVD